MLRQAFLRNAACLAEDFLAAASTGIAGSTIADSALADTLTDVPPRVMKCTRETDGIAMRSSTLKTRGLCTIP